MHVRTNLCLDSYRLASLSHWLLGSAGRSAIPSILVSSTTWIRTVVRPGKPLTRPLGSTQRQGGLEKVTWTALKLANIIARRCFTCGTEAVRNPFGLCLDRGGKEMEPPHKDSSSSLWSRYFIGRGVINLLSWDTTNTDPAMLALSTRNC